MRPPDAAVPAVTRRAALALAAGLLLLPARAMAQRLDALARGGTVPHPTPRPGITAANVLDPARVPQRYREAYEAARAVPEVLDGIFCHCDCAAHRGMRSLLSCFETEMPTSCGICTGEARLAYRLSRQGKSLGDIRAAIDAAYARG